MTTSYKSSKRQFLVKITGIDGFWMTKTGGDLSADTTKVFDGGSKQPDVLAGPAEAANVVVTRGYDRVRDNPLIVNLRSQIGTWTTTISVQPTDRDLNATSEKAVNYPNALLVGMVEPEVDASSGDAATWQLEFAIGNWN